MVHRTITAAALAATILAGTALFAPPASAGNVAWSVSIGGPGFAIAAGGPGYWGGYPAYGHRHAYRYAPAAYPYYSPYYTTIAPAPVVYTAPVVYPAPLVYAPPVVYRAPAYAHRRVVAAPHYAAPYGRY
jgi:hypothetical protein